MATRRPRGMPSDSELWIDADGGRWLLTITEWAVVDGRMEPVGVELRSVRRTGRAADDWARRVLPPSSRYDEVKVRGREPLPITATAWRAPPLAELLGRIRPRHAAELAEILPGHKGLRTWRAQKRRRGAVTQEDVVAVYLAACVDGLPPSKTVATELHLSRDAAYQRVRRARVEGLLPQTKKPGRASGGTALDEGKAR